MEEYKIPDFNLNPQHFNKVEIQRFERWIELFENLNVSVTLEKHSMGSVSAKEGSVMEIVIGVLPSSIRNDDEPDLNVKFCFYDKANMYFVNVADYDSHDAWDKWLVDFAKKSPIPVKSYEDPSLSTDIMTWENAYNVLKAFMKFKETLIASIPETMEDDDI